ncbi:MAG: hypothetical protein DSZ33_04775, partial [Gammaproteobacteria bacterium]
MFTCLTLSVSSMQAMAGDDEDDHGHGDGHNQTFAVTKAEWKADKHKLKIKGTGSSGSSVLVVNAYDPAQHITFTVFFGKFCKIFTHSDFLFYLVYLGKFLFYCLFTGFYFTHNHTQSIHFGTQRKFTFMILI